MLMFNEKVNTNDNEKVCIFNKSILNALTSFIPQETILCGAVV